MNPLFWCKSTADAFIGIGSNLDEPTLQVGRALEELGCLPVTHLQSHSSLYRSAPLGRTDQPDFINAVAQIRTALSPQDLLKALLQIEQNHGRVREYPNAPRTLDLDILLYDDLQLNDGNLILPHPRMHERAFVLQPLLEIVPECNIPGHGSISELLAACAGQRLEREQQI
jgi:2-amino-4-hydroxy-6-hydroxymethyldihydropteridine diphosphokinase